MNKGIDFEPGASAPSLGPGPVFYSEERSAWIVTRYADILTVLRDNERYSAVNSIEIAPFDSFRPEVRAILATGYPRFPGMIELDPPDHTRFRNLVNTAFTPRRVAELEPRIRQVVGGLIDGFGGRGPIDFVERFAFPLPMTVIGQLVGANPEDADLLRDFTNNFRTLEAGLVNTLPLEQQLRCAGLFVQFQKYAAGMVEKRRASPTDDLTSALMQARMEDGTELDLEQTISMVIHLLFAGQETTVMLLGSMMLRLLTKRELWEAVVRRPELAPTVVDEALRFDAPVTYHSRRTKTPVELGGAAIPAGQDVQLIFDAANHDEAAFPEPSQFKVDRPDASRHLSFGRGVHFCVGAPLARLEVRIALQELGSRLPTLRLDPSSAHAYVSHQMLHSLQHLMVDW
jgi:cytochrome P450